MFEDLRRFIEYVRQKGQVLEVEEELSVRHEIAAVEVIDGKR